MMQECGASNCVFVKRWDAIKSYRCLRAMRKRKEGAWRETGAEEASFGGRGRAKAVAQRGLCFSARWGCKQAGIPGVLCLSSSTDCRNCLSHRLLLSVNGKQTGSADACPAVNSLLNTNNNNNNTFTPCPLLVYLWATERTHRLHVMNLWVYTHHSEEVPCVPLCF